MEPSLSQIMDEIAGGIYYPNDESGDAYKFSNELSRQASDHGVIFQYYTSIFKLLIQGNVIQGLETSSGLITADKYILAAGCFSPVLAKTIGLQLPIKAVKGYSVTFNDGNDDSRPGISIIDETRHIAITPFANRLRISGLAELCNFDTTISDKKIVTLVNYFK